MRSVRIFPSAQVELAEIWGDSVRNWGIATANSYFDRIESNIELLRETPTVGNPIVGTRYWSLTSHLHSKDDGHRLIYRFDEETVTILGFVHTKRDLSRIMEMIHSDFDV